MTAAVQRAAERRWGCSVSCGILGWVLDAYDFFVLIFLLDPLSAQFGVSKAKIVATITVTLVFRPIGALLLGSISDKYGRRYPLLACVLYFSVITALTPFAPSYTVFLIMRALYGIGMGGYWGVGAAMVMESCPVRWRGLFSGMLQAGYSIGYLLAAASARLLEPRYGWRSMFFAGLILAVAIAVLSVLAAEPVAAKKAAGQTVRPFATLREHWRSFALLTLFMTVITCLSHGTQDLYPDFLKIVHGFSAARVADTAILYNLGAIIGAVVIGRLSDRFGRKNCMYAAIAVCVLALPAWAFGSSFAVLLAGSFIMQMGVQGAFGVVPAYLNELSPPQTRSLFPGLVYQLGVLLGAPCVIVEYALRSRFGYARALAFFECAVFVVLCLVLLRSKEQHGRSFVGE
jgi:SHS family lactate transporter-like MFS transporter